MKDNLVTGNWPQIWFNLLNGMSGPRQHFLAGTVVELKAEALARSLPCHSTSASFHCKPGWLLAQLMPAGILQGWDCTFPVKRSISIVGSTTSQCYWHLCSPPCLENEPEILHTVNNPAAQSSLQLLLARNLSQKSMGSYARPHGP